MTADDFAETVARFGAALRAAGIATDADRLGAFVAGVRSAPQLGAFELYWYARIALLSSHEHVAAFDRVFTTFWAGKAVEALAHVPPSGDDGTLPGKREAERSGERATAVGTDAASQGAERRVDRVVGAVSREVLREADFAQFAHEEWLAAQRLMRELPNTAELRLARRTAVRPHGRRLHVGATIRQELRTCGVRIEPRYRVRRTNLRPVVFLCDVSGSMAPYGRALLQYGYVLVRARPKVSVFAFATRLSDLTVAFRSARSQAAFDRVVRGVLDRGGGTLIGSSLRSFNRRFGIRGLARGATVVIVSDGCEREDPLVLAGEMATLARLSRRIVWVNPRKSDPAYEPITRGMRAALPYVDTFLQGHNLRSLDAVAHAIRGATAHLI